MQTHDSTEEIPLGTVFDRDTGLFWTKLPSRTNIFQDEAGYLSRHLVLGGCSSWRLPTTRELAGLYQKGCGANNIRLGIGLKEWSKVWSSTKGYVYDFSRGEDEYCSDYNSSQSYGTGDSLICALFVASIDKRELVQARQERQRREEAAQRAPRGTVLDPVTGLLWTKEDNGDDILFSGFFKSLFSVNSWGKTAQGYCRNLRLGGFSDWRLPTIDELAWLYEKGAGAWNIRLGIKVRKPWVWSSTEGKYRKQWRFLFETSSPHEASLDQHLGVVLCVRETSRYM